MVGSPFLLAISKREKWNALFMRIGFYGAIAYGLYRVFI